MTTTKGIIRGVTTGTVAALLGASLLIGGCGGSDDVEEEGEAVPGELLVGVRDTAFGTPVIEQLISAHGQVLHADRNGSFYRIHLNDGETRQQAEAALKHRDILYTEPNFVTRAYATPNDTDYATQYSADVAAELEAAWAAWAAGANVDGSDPIVVAVVDTGVRSTHEDLAAKIASAGGQDFTGRVDPTDASDDNGHGTEVAGIIAAAINNSKGIAGVASWASGADPAVVVIMPVKVLNSAGAGNHAALAAGIEWAISNGADIVSISLGSASPSWTLQKAVQDAWTAGLLVVAAGGNNSSSSMKYPAAYQASNQGVLAAGALDSNDLMQSTSNYGSWVNLLGPGVALESTGNAANNDYPTGLSGSSFGAAYVAGVAALVWSAYPPARYTGGTMTNALLRNTLLASVKSYDHASAKTIASGGGRIDVQKALTLAASPSTARIGSVVFDAKSVKAGSSINGAVVLNKAASAGGMAITLAASPSTAVSVPASVTVAVNARVATFKLTGQAVASDTAVTITATDPSLNAVTAAVSAKMPGVKSVTLSPASAIGGASVTGTVSLDSTAAAGGVTVSLASDNAAATVAASVVVAAGQSTKTFSITTSAVASSTTVHITASIGSSNASATLTVKPQLAAVAVSPSSVKGGTSVTGTVRLNTAAGAGGAVVTLASNNAAAVVAGSVTVPVGSTSAAFTITTTAVANDATATITATLGAASSTATLRVLKPLLSAISVDHTTLYHSTATETATATLTLDGPAPTGDATVVLTANSGAIAIPDSQVVLAGARTATFTISAAAAVASTAASVSATYGATKTASLTVRPAFSSFTLASGTVTGGASVVGTVTLSDAAKAGGVTISLASSDSAAPVPGATMSIAQATRSNTFTITTVETATDVNATITVTFEGVSIARSLKVKAPTPSSLTLSAATVVSGGTVTGTVTLGGAAPSGGLVVTLSSSNTSAATVPATVSFAQGDTSKTFSVTAANVAAAASTTIRAALGSVSKTASLSVTPAVLSAMTLASSSIVEADTTTATVTLSGKAPAGGVVVTIFSTNASIASVPVAGTVTVLAGQTTATFTVTGVAAGGCGIVATLGAVNKSANITVTAAP
jgi:trimeric autotransporter adhesin